jgi:tRNA threonylcarbamoyladenosine biosynthesis protein TsaE
MKTTFSLDQIQIIAEKILASNPAKIITFNGTMGAGKTTLIQAICKQLDVRDNISSPTFSLVNEYKTKDNQVIYHFDFYRIKIASEALDMGAEEYFYSGNYCFIEWAEKINHLLPEKHTIISLSILEDGNRRIEIY